MHAVFWLLLACRTKATDSIDADQDGFSAELDCDDSDAEIFPEAEELCDQRDNNCDGSIDEGLILFLSYPDGDGDGFGSTEGSAEDCQLPDGFVVDSGDCDDADVSIYPGAEDYCDGVDRDCDGEVDEADSIDAVLFYSDVDGDGYGDPLTEVRGCDLEGLVLDWSDCDDRDASVFPGSHSPDFPFDGVDTNCDGQDLCLDIGCDGWPDLLFPSYSDGVTYDTLSRLYLGSAAGFSEAEVLELPGMAISDADTGDFNGDGYVDVLLTNNDPQITERSSWVYFGSSNGLEVNNPQPLLAAHSWRSCTADLNQDGYTDVLQVAHSPLGEVHKSTLFMGSAAGISQQGLQLSSNNSYDCALQDLNQDGWLDILLPAFGGSGQGLIYWSSEGSFSPEDFTALPGYDFTLHAVTADADGDGWLDLLLGGHQEGAVWFGSETGFSENSVTLFEADYLTKLLSVDVDQDGHSELISCNYLDATSGSYDVRSAVWWGPFSGNLDLRVESFETHGCRDAEVADLNQDGHPELIFINYLSGTQSAPMRSTQSYVYWGSDEGYIGTNRTALDSHASQHAVIADLNLDGFPDVVLGNYQDDDLDHSVESMIYWGSEAGLDSMTTFNTLGVAGRPLVIAAP